MDHRVVRDKRAHFLSCSRTPGHEREGTFGVLLIHGGDRTAVNRAENMAYIRDCLSPPVLLSQCHHAVAFTSAVPCRQPCVPVVRVVVIFCSRKRRNRLVVLMGTRLFFLESQFLLGFICVLGCCR